MPRKNRPGCACCGAPWGCCPGVPAPGELYLTTPLGVVVLTSASPGGSYLGSILTTLTAYLAHGPLPHPSGWPRCVNSFDDPPVPTDVRISYGLSCNLITVGMTACMNGSASTWNAAAASIPDVRSISIGSASGSIDCGTVSGTFTYTRRTTTLPPAVQPYMGPHAHATGEVWSLSD